MEGLNRAQQTSQDREDATGSEALLLCSSLHHQETRLLVCPACFDLSSVMTYEELPHFSTLKVVFKIFERIAVWDSSVRWGMLLSYG